MPLDDIILHNAPIVYILAGCRGVLQEINREDIYETHFELLSKNTSRNTLTSFFTTLARLPQKEQQMCFDKIVSTLRERGEGTEHIAKRLVDGKRLFTIIVQLVWNFCTFISRKPLSIRAQTME